MIQAGRRRRRRVFSGVVVVCAVGAVLGATLAFAGIVTRTKTVQIAGQTKGSAAAKCPKGMAVVMGGFHNTLAPDENPEALLTGLHRSLSGRIWTDSATNDASEAANATSIAYCGRKRTLDPVTNTVGVPSATGPSTLPTSVTAKCPRGQRVALGGVSTSIDPVFSLSSDAVYLSQMRRTSKRSWKVSGLNLGGNTSTAPLTAVAYCGKAPGATERSKTVSILNHGNRGSATAKCHRGEKLAFGGFKADVTETDEFVLLNGLVRTSKRKWRAQAVNANTDTEDRPGNLTAFAYCS
jgi:hypothetical protein